MDCLSETLPAFFFNVAIVKSKQIFNKNIGSVAHTAISVEETHNI